MTKPCQATFPSLLIALSTLSLAGLALSGAEASAQVTFYPIKPDPALDGVSGMGSQSARWLRASGTALFGTIVDGTSSSQSFTGAGAWGLDGVATWNGSGPLYDIRLHDQGEDGVSRITEWVSQQSEMFRGTFSDGSSISINSSFGFGFGRYGVISPNGLTIFGTNFDQSGSQDGVYRYQAGQAPELVYDSVSGELYPVAADFDGTTMIGRMASGELARWTELAGVEILMPVRPHGQSALSPMDINYDGSIVVGRDLSNFPVVWREGLGLEVLDDCPLASGGSYYDLQCSPDGQRIDAWRSNGFFTWNATDGWRTLRQVVQEAGARDLSTVDPFVRFTYRSKDGVAVIANLGQSPINMASQSVVFIGEPAPGALGSNYCGPAPRNSSGYRAIVQATGTASVQANSLTMSARFLPAQTCGYVLSSPGIGFVQAPGSTIGNLCLGGGQPIGRHDQAGEVCVANGDGVIDFPIDLTSLPSPTMSYAAQPGETLNFQVWFRDTDSSGAPASNFTDAVSVTFE